MCYLVYIILPLSISVSIGTLLAITADRYRAIVFPVKSKLTRKTVMLVVAVIWVVSALTALPLPLILKHFSPEPGIGFCWEAWPTEVALETYWVSMFVFQYLLPLCVIALLAGITAYTLRKNSLPVGMETCAQSEAFRKTIRKRAKQTKRITNMLIALVLLYAICMLPQHAVFTFWLRYHDADEDFTEMESVLKVIANIFPIANSALNAIAYGTLNKEFKAVFNGLFKCLCFNVNTRKELFGRQTVSHREMPDRRNGRSHPLLHDQEWKDGSVETASPVTRRLYDCDRGDIRKLHNKQNNLPDHKIEECLLVKNPPVHDMQKCLLATTIKECSRMLEQKRKLQHAFSESSDKVHQKETVV